MNYFQKILFYIFISIYSSLVTAQSITVDDTKNAKQLVENVLFNTPCAILSNPVASGDDYSGSTKSYAYFNADSSSFPFSEGLLLSTWSSINSVGPFIENRGGGDVSWLGDTDLEQALGITTTKNATALEFDFKAETDFISFNYIFASNEYQKYFPCEFSDGFAFLIKEKGSSDPYQNLAVLPNSVTPVSSTNVHPKISNYVDNLGDTKFGCPPKNEDFFAGFNNSSSPINYGGQTKVLTAQSTVVAGKNYHIKLVIADHKNNEFDSAVFIEAGSFAPKINLGPDQTLCFNDKTILDTGLSNPAYSYEWFKDGVSIYTGSNSFLEVSNAGNYAVTVTLAAGCTATGKVKITYKSKMLKTLTQCGGSSGTATFDLNLITSAINLSANSTIKYYSDLAGTEITNAFTYETTTKTVYARITGKAAECEDFVEIKLNVLAASNAVQNLIFCDNDIYQDGIRTFNLKKEIDLKIVPLTNINSFVEGYYSNLDDAANKKNKLNNSYTSVPNQNIFARVENGSDCYGIFELNFNVITYTSASSDLISDVIINDFSGNNAVEIKTIGTGPFEYSMDGISFQDDSIFTNVQPGEYTIYARENTSCTISKSRIYVLDYPRFFTPNADGYNDLWKIKNLDLYPEAIITIFDRYGKLLKQFNATNKGWNGVYKGFPLPADDYWFHIKFTDLKSIKGHFSLKR